MMKRILSTIGLLFALLAVAAPTAAQPNPVGVFSRVKFGSCTLRSGSGSPESAVTGTVCDVYVRTDTGAIYAKTSGSGNTGWTLLAAGAGSGTVTSVGLSLPSLFTVAGSPVSTSGTLTATLASQSANVVFAGPASGSAAAPTFRKLVFGDWASNSCASGQIPKYDGAAWQCADDDGSGSAAPTAAQYLTLATDATLTNERVLTAGAGVAFTDAGAGSTLTIDADGPNIADLDADHITSGTLAAARGGAGTVSGLLKANGSGTVSAASAGTDYIAAVGGSDGDVQVNDGGALGGDASFHRDPTTHAVTITRATSPDGDGVDTLAVAESGTAPRGMVSVEPGNSTYNQIGLGMKDYAAEADKPAYLWRSVDGSGNAAAGIEVLPSDTAGNALGYATGVGQSVGSDASNGIGTPGLTVYQYGGLGTGAVPGLGLVANRNDSGDGAASYLSLQQKDGTRKYIWFDATGAPRYGAAPPTEDDTTVSDTSGSLFGGGGGGSGTVTNTGTLTSGKAVIGNGSADVTVSSATGVAHLASGTLTGSNVDLASEVTGTLSVANLPASVKTSTVGITIDGGGSAITTGIKGYITAPVSGTITSWTLLSTDTATTSGSITIEVDKDTYANYPPNSADKICASACPSLSSATKNTNNSLGTWSATVTAGDVFGFNVTSAASVTRVTLIMTIAGS